MAGKIEQAEKISSNIKKLREDRDWNQSKLASEAGVSGAALSKIEKGDGRVPTIVVLRKLASALNVPVHEITGEVPDTSSDSEKKHKEFYRKWGDTLDSLEPQDQEILKGMAERLKGLQKGD